MADEVEVTFMQLKSVRGETPLSKIGGCVTELIDASGTQDKTAACPQGYKMARITSSLATRIAVLDLDDNGDASDVVLGNSVSVAADTPTDTLVNQGQVIASKVI